MDHLRWWHLLIPLSAAALGVVLVFLASRDREPTRGVVAGLRFASRIHHFWILGMALLIGGLVLAVEMLRRLY